ncbi:MAG TPA: D-Ala-D-Ala carboxypeptidase family metallohydrolase [Actinomycetota bacterium]|nr:D-Ala-D-Ala carboxypeptidase family metallohydrolase [Actinomycetota bacterium]
MTTSRHAYRCLGALAISALLVSAAVITPAPEALASTFGSRTLARGSSGADVLELQIRVAGWYSNCAGVPCHEHFPLDSSFGTKTERAVKNFQKAYGLPIDGRADGDDFDKLKGLERSDGSTLHFSWSEFHEKKGTRCSTSNAGTFNGGRVDAKTVRENVRRLMYRLEVLRHRRVSPVYIGSGFRSVNYNSCVKGASQSQHMYGTAMDGKMKHVHQGHMRGLAKTSEFHGIFCYDDPHNHLDIRKDNPATGGGFVWPSTDPSGRDRTAKGGICYGGYSSPPTTGNHPPAEGPSLAEVSVRLEDSATDGTDVEDPEGAAMRDGPEDVWMSEDE